MQWITSCFRTALTAHAMSKKKKEKSCIWVLRALAYEAAYARYGVCGLLDVIDMFYINLDEKDATSSV